MPRRLAGQAPAEEVDQLPLLLGVCAPQLAVAGISFTPRREGCPHRLRLPGRQVHAVRHRSDVLPDRVTPGRRSGPSVQPADRGHDRGLPQAEGGEVERVTQRVVRPASQLRQALRSEVDVRGHRPDELAGQRRVVALVARRDRRVEGHHHVPAGAGQRIGAAQVRVGVAQHPRPRQEDQRRVSLVEVPDRRHDAERVERPRRANAEQQLLGQPLPAIGDVQLIGDPLVLGLVARQVGVQQQDRHPPDLSDPHRHADRTPGQVHRDLQRLAVGGCRPPERHVRRIERGLEMLLPTVGVDSLAEVPAVVERADTDERQTSVRCGLAQVAGQDTQPAGVDRQRLVERELGAQVGDAAGEIRAQPGRIVVDVPLQPATDGVRVQHEAIVVGQLGPAFVGGVAEDVDRVSGPGPGVRIDPGEEPEGFRMPGPPQVLGEVAKPLQAGRSRQVHALDRRDPDGLGHRRRMISVRPSPRSPWTRYATHPPDGQLLGGRGGGCPRYPGRTRLGASGSGRPGRVCRGWRRHARVSARRRPGRDASNGLRRERLERWRKRPRRAVAFP